MLAQDTKVPFPAYFLRTTASRGRITKTEQRQFIAEHAKAWLRLQKRRRSTGAIMIDIDDTLIDGNQAVQHGFQFMQEMYMEASLHFPIHIVTARPYSDHENVMKLLQKHSFCIAPDRLHMLPTELYYTKDLSHVEDFKYNCYRTISHLHHGVIARFGDKMWDVAYLPAMRMGLFNQVDDKEAYIFKDPNLKGTVSFKLPGTR